MPRDAIFYKDIDYGRGGGGGASSGALEVLNITAFSYVGYNITVTHEDGITSATQEVPSTGEVSFTLTKPGIWTISNSNDTKTKTHICNVVDLSFGGISKSLTIVSASENNNQTITCANAGTYIVLVGSSGSSNYQAVSFSVTNGTIIDQEREFYPNGSYGSEIQLLMVSATAGTTIQLTPGSCDRVRVMVLYTDEKLDEENVLSIGTKKDQNYTTTFNLNNNTNACIFCIGTAGNDKSITGNNFSRTEKYNNNNMNYDYVTATANTTVTVSYTGGTSYGSSGIVVIG